MSDEIKAAMRRIEISQTYMPDPQNCWHDGDAVFGECTLNDDLHTVADAYLAEHDETPVTEEWLRPTIGMETDDWGILARDMDEISLTFIEGTFGVTFNSPDIECKTRGDVRRLCAALGIPLTEAKGASK